MIKVSNFLRVGVDYKFKTLMEVGSAMNLLLAKALDSNKADSFDTIFQQILFFSDDSLDGASKIHDSLR